MNIIQALKEIMLLNISNHSDDDNTSYIENVIQEKTIIHERFKKKQVPNNEISENDVMNFKQDYYVKEEVMLSDISDLSEDESLDNDDNKLRKSNISFRNFENNINQEPGKSIETQLRSEKIDRELDVDNISKDYEKESQQTSKKTLANTTILVCTGCKATQKSFHNSSEIMCQKCGKLVEYQCLKCDNLKTKWGTKAYYHMRHKCCRPKFLYQCEYCDYRSNTQNRLKCHMLSKHRELCGVVPFLNCKFCDYKTKFKVSLKKHLTMKHSHLKEKKIQKILERATEIELKLIDKIHNYTDGKEELATTPKNNDTKFCINVLVKLYCSKCDATFQKVPGRNRKCPQCSALTHYQCLKCDRRYINHSSMYTHQKSVCARKEAFGCADCDYSVATKRRLRLHIERVHATVAPEDYVKCRTCGKEFKYRTNQRNHERRCGKGPEQQCKFCPYRRKDKRSIKRHEQRHHVLRPENGDFILYGTAGSGLDVLEVLEPI